MSSSIVAVNGELCFNELHVISDLHLGGPMGRQVFTGTAELSGLVNSLATRPSDRAVALVINGDFIDFLAEEPALPFDPAGAVHKLDRIRADPSFSPIWTALERFLTRSNSRLVLVLGNHDIELALPRVRHHLVESLCQGDDSRRGRIVVSQQGHGFAARVGNRRVLCLHGNEADTWNVIDFDRLRRVGSELQLGSSLEAWMPNAGTMLVIDVMNELKRRFPFVDLLKPEKAAVIPILWALDQGTGARLVRCLGVAKRLSWDKIRRGIGLLSNDVDGREGPLEGSGDPQLLYELLQDRAVPPSGALLSAQHTLIEDAAQQLRDGVDPLTLVTESGKLGIAGALWSRIHDEPPERVARRALESLAKDQTFSRTTPDDTFERLDAMVGADADILIAGHTHLEKDLARSRAVGRYFNTGTWARLIRISPNSVRDPEQFQQVWKALQLPTLAELDEKRHEGKPLVISRRTVASVWEERGVVHSALRRVKLEGGSIVLVEPAAGEV